MSYLRGTGLLSSLLIVGLLGGLLAPGPSEALTVTIDDRPVQITTNSAACSSGYNTCAFITPGTYGAWTVGNVDATTNRARVMIGDNSAAGSLDLMKLTGITFTPVVISTGTKTATVVITHTYNAGGGNPQGDYAWGFGMAGHFDPPATENIVSDRLQLIGTGTFPTSTPASISLGGVDTGVLGTPTTLNLNGSITKSKAAVVVKPNCNTGSARCAPTISQTFTITVAGQDTLKLTDSLVSASTTCRPVDQVIPIRPDLYALMLKLDPTAPNDINQLSAWLGRMGEKYLNNTKQKALLAKLILELDKWLANSVPGTCPEVEETLNAVVAADLAVELANAVATGAVPAGPAPATGTITITKNTDGPGGGQTGDSFTFNISGPSSSTQTISMGGQNSESIIVTVAPGTYNITENPLSGWSLTDSDCDDGFTTNVVVQADGNVSCTFHNSTLVGGGASFTGLGFIPGSSSGSAAFDVSSDGSVVVGNALAASGQEASRWTAAGGMVSLTPGVFGQSTAASSDGSVVVGSKNDTPGVSHAFRWTTGTGLADLGVLPSSGPGGNTSEALAVSADGNVVVGSSLYGTTMFGPRTEAFRWTPTGGMVGLGDLAGGPFHSRATAVSADGSVIVGWALGASGQEMFRWTSTGGMQGLGVLNAQPTAVSGDGSVIVGQIPAADGLVDAFRWSQATGIEILPGLGGSLSGLRSLATDVSDDGSVIVGRSLSPSPDYEAVIWRMSGSTWTVRTLQDVLATDYGVPQQTGWRLLAAEGISADGRAIVGWGVNLVNGSEAWRTVLPE